MHNSYFLSEKAVQAINQYYFDIVNQNYDFRAAHPQTHKQESIRWKRITKKLFTRKKPIKIYDIGSGTGFVALSIGEFLKENDKFVCSDISEKILNVARSKISEKMFKCDFKYVKIPKSYPLKLPFDSESADFVTLNSVLHHIRDVDNFKKELHRILKPNGILIIAHEPNKYFYEHRLLGMQVFIFRRLLRLRRIINQVFNKNLYNKVNLNLKKISDKEIADIINKKLIDENLIIKPLSYKQIKDNVDIRAEVGFRPETLFPNYKTLYLETYDYLSSISTYYFDRFYFIKHDLLMQKLFPKKGRTFFMILQNSDKGI